MCLLIEQMEDCVHLVCESVGVHEDDEVNVERMCRLYQKVFFIPANLDDTQRALTQVSAQNGGCPGKMVLHVLLVMERERESREKLYWELQVLKLGRICTSDEMKKQNLLPNTSYKQRKQGTKQQWSVSSLLCEARRLYMRLDLGGVWSVLPSLSHRCVSPPPLNMRNHTSSDILLLLQYKYETIKEQLYREMLQDEHGVGWWDSLTAHEQLYCVCDLGVAADQAFKQMDLLQVCQLPGALRSYRSSGQVVLQACDEVVKPRDQAWSPRPREQAWTAVVFLSELETHYQEERDSLAVLLNRMDRTVLREIYLSVCVAVKRAEIETHSYTALLASRQYWEKWPYTRGSVNQELVTFWLQDRKGPTRRFQQNWRTTSCTQQQAVLQCLVMCQELERKSLVKILHTLSLDELQDQTHTPAYNADERSSASLRQDCVVSLREIKTSLQGVSWSDCAIQLLTQLTLTHDEETCSVLHSLPLMDSRGISALLHKYESELHSPKLHNLNELLQPQTHTRGMSTATALTDGGERPEERQQDPSDNETQALCSGCGVVLVPEDAPYLEILGTRKQTEEDSTERREGREEERVREQSEEKIEGAKERREEKKDEISKGEVKEVEMLVEKQGSLITLAWSKPTDAAIKDQEMSAALAEEEISTDSHSQISTKQVHGDPVMTPNQVQDHTDPADGAAALIQSNKEHEEAHSKHPEHTHSAEENTLRKTLQEESSVDADCEGSTTQPTEAEPEDTHSSAQTHTPEAEQESELVCSAGEVCEEKPEHVCVDTCEEQQLQREATMRSLITIQRRAERRVQRDRERQLLRVQERLSIIQNRKSDEDLLGLTREDTLRHLTSTLQQEDEQHQKILVREKLQQLRRERSYILQSRRERNTAGFKELLAPTAQHMANTEDGL